MNKSSSMSEESETFHLPATSAESRKINAIDKDTVHKICSGQVVLNLAVAVKELVENALDAGATLVEVKLRDYGAELVEVTDNGSGVEEKNFQGLTAKYHTSKLKEFTDLESIETFGFRGEALSSLCALSDMVITTRHCTAGHATKLTLNHEGIIQTRTPCARSIGTTVTLSNLFATLPVRKKEFQRNIKREFLRMCQILQAYCLVSVGVRIICSNQTPKGGKSVVMGTHGAHSVLDNVTALFGPKQTAELMELKPAIGSNGKLQDLDVSDFDDTIALTQEELDNFNLSKYTIEGYISSCAHGSGRSSKDRQFFFINSRPCEPKQISKLVNDAYHRYNVHQHPFVYLNLKMERTEVDVNLTPDKRQVLVNNEKILLLAIRKSIKKTFGKVPSSFKVQNLNLSDSSRLLNISLPELKGEGGEEDHESSIDRSRNESTDKGRADNFLSIFQAPKSTVSGGGGCGALKRKRNATENGLQKIKNFLEASRSNDECSKAVEESNEGYSQDEDEMQTVKVPKHEENPYDLTILRASSMNGECIQPMKESVRVIRCSSSSQKEELSQEDPAVKEGDNRTDPSSVDGPSSQESVTELLASMMSTIKSEPSIGSFEEESVRCEDVKEENIGAVRIKEEPTSESFRTIDQFAAPMKRVVGSDQLDIEEPPILIDDEPPEEDLEMQHRNHQLLTISHESLERLIEREQTLRSEKSTNADCPLSRLRFKSKINPASNRAAESELQTEITKEDFGTMQIVGQFNLGFIVARLGEDLFIVDQHATDEKYNFEDLQRTTVLQNQRLVVPQPLELTAVNEMILMDNLNVFEMNGFKFEIDADAPTTRKVKLTAKPYSRNWEFGKEDIDELIFMLQDAPSTVCRPSRVRAMFASRACRKSVMIGKALSVREMERLVKHMGDIEQPWNCPHGRPTMRHLVNLRMLKQLDETSDSS